MKLIRSHSFTNQYYTWYNVKHFIAHLEQAKECVIKILYLNFDEKSYKGKVSFVFFSI